MVRQPRSFVISYNGALVDTELNEKSVWKTTSCPPFFSTPDVVHDVRGVLLIINARRWGISTQTGLSDEELT